MNVEIESVEICQDLEVGICHVGRNSGIAGELVILEEIR